MSNYFISAGRSTGRRTTGRSGRSGHFGRRSLSRRTLAAALSAGLLLSALTGGVAPTATTATAAPLPVTAPNPVTASTPAVQGDLPEPVQEKLADLFFKIQEIVRPTPKTIPSSEVKKGVALFLYHPEVGLYTANECKVDGLTHSTITINVGCPFDPIQRNVLIAQFYKLSNGQVTKMAFYKAGTVQSAVPGKTTIRRVQGDLPLVAQTPPDPAPARVTFQ